MNSDLAPKLETCIHCQTQCPEMDMEDGVCPSCKSQDLPGRSILHERHAELPTTKIIVVLLLVGILAATVLAFFLSYTS